MDGSICESYKRMTAPVGKQYHIFEKIRFILSTQAFFYAIISVRLQRRRLLEWRISRKRPHAVRACWPMCEQVDENHTLKRPRFTNRGLFMPCCQSRLDTQLKQISTGQFVEHWVTFFEGAYMAKNIFKDRQRLRGILPHPAWIMRIGS